MRKWLIPVAAATLLAVGGGVAYASIPGPGGVVNACYKNSTGMLIVIDSAASCPTGYTALNWNQAGPPGPAGTNGTNGVSGYEVVQGSVSVPADGGIHTGTISCPSGKVVLGGGTTSDEVTGQPSADGTGWDYTFQAAGGGGLYNFRSSITCATAG
jgi:hypothetical protein